MSLRAQIRPELWEAISKPYESEIYNSAILEAIHHLSDILRERANVDGDGVSLVGQALGGDSPRLRINKFQTETEKGEQRGFEQLLRGIYQSVRNPRSHDQIRDNQGTADAIIGFIDYILGVVSQAKQPFDLNDWTERVFDTDFVASNRYAQLLVSDVPARKYNEALITIYRDKMQGDGKKLRYIVEALIQTAGEDRVNDFLEVVSDDLKIVQEEKTVQMVLQILPERLWPNINEAARLRIENKLIRSIEVGAYSSKTGWLATWASSFFKHFTLKRELREVLLKKLKGSNDEQDYVAAYFLWTLPETVDEHEGKSQGLLWQYLYTKAISEAVLDPFGTRVLSEKLTELYNLPSHWRELIIQQLKPLEEIDNEYYQKVIGSYEDDIPF